MNKFAKLLENFEPNHYDVTFDINEEQLTFRGHVLIKGRHLKGDVALHSRDLSVETVKINDATAEYTIDKDLHEIMIQSDTSGQDIECFVEFNGKITESMLGIYPSNFKHDGKDKQIIATQFEAHHAREAFPCIDEPAAKATFQITLLTDKDSTVLSNTLPQSEETNESRKTTVFKKTPKMSSYLLSFATGEMHSVEATTKSGTLVRSFSSVAQPKKALQYSLDEAVDVLGFFEEYFDTPYPLEKCDQIALPDFDAGAMENWGMITYREVAMLTDPDNRSISSEQYVSLVIAHELSHQWFGNLVTMQWWDDLWLNESFASIMEHIALDSLHPEWHQWEHYTSSDVISCTSRDIYRDIQPVSVEVNDPELIETLFDPGIVYAKGGRLIKMLREHIGEEAFVAGLRTYFQEFAYSNATRDDLWRHFGDASGVKVKELMDEWLIKPGMPVLSVSKNEKDTDIYQERFLVDGTDEKSTWPVPLLSASEVEPNILTKQLQTFKTSENFPIFNEHGSGHYFVHYADKEHIEHIRSQIAGKELNSELRINLLNDMIMLSRGGYAQLTDALTLVTSMANEDRFSVWAMISRVLGTAMQLTEGNEDDRKHFKAIKESLASDLHKKLGWDDHEGDDPNTIQMRSMMISFMLGSEHPATIDKVKEMAANVANLSELPSEHRGAILIALVKQGDKELVNTLEEIYPDADPEMQIDISVALASIKDEERAQLILQKAIGKNGYVRNQDLMRWIAYFMRNHETRNVMWGMLVDEWDYFSSTFEQSKSFDFLPVYTAQVINTEEMAQKYRDLFLPLKDHKVLKRNISIGLADIDARVAWRKREEDQISNWLSDNVK